MRRFFVVTSSILLALAAVFFWASSGRLSEDELAQTKQYDAPASSTAPDSLTVTTYNLGYLSGMTNNEPVVRSDSFLAANMQEALALLHRTTSDVVAFQEIDYGSGRSGYVHQLDTLAARLNFATAAQAVNWDKRYIPFPYGRPAVHFGRTLSGQAVLSQFPIRQHQRVALSRPPQSFVRDAFYLDRLAQVVLLDLGGRSLAVINVHLEAFHAATRAKQARRVNAIYDQITAQGLPVLLLGDFNSPLPDSTSGRLPTDPRQAAAADSTMRLLLAETALRPTLPSRHPHFSGTYPADAPAQKIDHIFYPPAFMTPVDRKIRCGAPSPPSDHCAVTASFRLAPPAEWPTLESVPNIPSE